MSRFLPRKYIELTKAIFRLNKLLLYIHDRRGSKWHISHKKLQNCQNLTNLCHILHLVIITISSYDNTQLWNGEFSVTVKCTESTKNMHLCIQNRVRAIWRGILNIDNWYYEMSRKNNFKWFKPTYLSLVSHSRGPDPGMPEVRLKGPPLDIMFVHKASSAW